MAGLRDMFGALLFEGPNFVRGISPGRRFGWVEIRNRSDRFSPGEIPPGLTPQWEDTRGLHFCKIFPSAGALLLGRCRKDARFGSAPSREDREPEVSFLVGHRGTARAKNLLAVIASIAAQEGPSIECVVCEQDDEPRVRGILPGWVRYVFDRVPAGTPYNRSRAFNAAAAAARGKALILHDNDLLVPVQYAAAHAGALASGWDAANLKRFIFYLARGSSPEGRGARVVHVMQNARGGGSMAIGAGAFREIGGMDENFSGWGGEDVEFWGRCQTLRLCDSQYLPLIHLWHPAQEGKRELGGRGALTAEYFESVMARPATERIAELREKNRRHFG